MTKVLHRTPVQTRPSKQVNPKPENLETIKTTSAKPRNQLTRVF